MIDELESVWGVINSSLKQGEGQISAHGCPGDYSQKVFLAIERNGLRSVLIRLGKVYSSSWGFGCNGLIASVRQLKLSSTSEVNWYIQITCQNELFHSLFNSLITELSKELYISTEPTLALVDKILKGWKKFWDDPLVNILSKEDQIGLLGELYFMFYWLFPVFGVSTVNSWCGPLKLRHDFEFSRFSIEVKSTIQNRSLYQIHGISQLEAPENGKLFLFGLQMRIEVSASITLGSLVSRISDELAYSHPENEKFQELLHKWGYFSEFSEKYNEVHYEVLDQCLYIVDEGFPRVIQTMLPSATRQLIESMTYAVNLTSFMSHIIAKNQSEFCSFLESDG